MSLLFGVVKFDLPHSMDAASQTMKMSVTPTHISKGYFFHNLSKIPCKMEKGKRLTKFLKQLKKKGCYRLVKQKQRTLKRISKYK